MTTGVLGLLLLLLPQASTAKGAVTTVMNAAKRGDCTTVERNTLTNCQKFNVIVSWSHDFSRDLVTIEFDVESYRKNSGEREKYESLRDSIPSYDELMKLRKKHNRSGICVAAVYKGSNAEKAGLKAGDVIIEYNGQVVNRFDEIISAKKAAPSSGKVKIKIMRGDTPMDIWAEPGKLNCHTIELMTDVSYQREQIRSYFYAKIKALNDSLDIDSRLHTHTFKGVNDYLKASLGYNNFDELPPNSKLIQYDQEFKVNAVLKTIIPGVVLKDEGDLDVFKFDLITPGGKKTGRWIVNDIWYRYAD